MATAKKELLSESFFSEGLKLKPLKINNNPSLRSAYNFYYTAKACFEAHDV